MDECDISHGLEAISRHVVHCNGYAERMKPWELNKDPANQERLATVLYHLAESVAHAAVLLSPILPDAAAKLADQLNRPSLTNLKLADLRSGGGTFDFSNVVAVTLRFGGNNGSAAGRLVFDDLRLEDE